MLVLRVTGQLITKWIKDNFPASPQTDHPMDTYRAFLRGQGATGDTFHDMESTFLALNGYTQGTLQDRWTAYMASLYTFPKAETLADKIREFFSKIISFLSSYYLQEDGTSKYILEDGSGFYIL